jgi:hypothetical protein
MTCPAEKWRPHPCEPTGCPTPGACSAAKGIEDLRARLAAAEVLAEKAEAAIDKALQLFDPDYPDNPIRPQDRGEEAARQVLRAALAKEQPND